MYRSRAMPSQTALTRELLIIIIRSNYSMWRNFRVFNFRRLGVWTKIFNDENFPIYGITIIMKKALKCKPSAQLIWHAF